ncbi:MAG: AMP-binding protein [Treponema sp.]|nr:AMP-binding protein [Treponema sp.]
MSKKEKRIPWKFLDEYRGRDFSGEWPTFPELLEIQSKRFAERPYFTDFDGPDGSKRSWTYSQVNALVHQIADFMISEGIKKGDRIAVSGKNSPEWGMVYLAALYASAIIVPVDNGLYQKEVENIVNTAEPKMFFCEDDKYDYLKADYKNMKVYSLNPAKDDYVLKFRAEKAVTPNEKVSCEDTAAILFTSGTTGNPKGVMLSHKNLISDGYIAQTNLLILPTDVFYALLPIHHAYTMQAAFICPMEVGAEIVFGKSMAVSRLMKELKEGKISIMLGVPLLYNKLLFGINKGIRAKGALVAGIMACLRGISFLIKKLTGKNLGHKIFKPVLQQANIYTLRVAICGGGPLAKSVFKQYQAMGIDFIQGYGLTETSPIIALNPLEHFKLASVGQAFYPYMEAKIINVDEKIKKAPFVGEIVVKGPMVMQGYYKMPEETAKMYTEDGFFKTGDLGWMDKENYIMLCGRAKNLIVTSGGKNVYPEEIEDAFQLYDEVKQVTIQGYHKDGDKTSEEIEALIYPSDELFAKLGVERNNNFVQDEVLESIQKIVSKVNKTLQSYEHISKITILKEPLAMTTSLKVKRNYKK